MTDLIATFHERFGDWTTALLQHLQISLLSLLLAIIIAIPLAIWLYNKKRASEAILQVTGIFQTIPSLALLGLLIPLMGIGTVPAVTALVIYALFPIVQGTVTGLRGIDPSLVEAGEAFGMTQGERLRKYEIPLAMPVIIAGVRTAAIMIIGTATLASLIGAGGLGDFILLGIDRNDNSLILIGAISAALLAILFSTLIHWLEKQSLKKIMVAFLVLVVGLVGSYTPTWATAIQASRSGIETLVIAGKLGPEPEILINMYKQLIEANSSLKVTVKPNFGKTTFLYKALKRGDIDIYPEFSGTITESLLRSKPGASSSKKSTLPDLVYKQARDGIYQQDQLILLKPMKFSDTYAVAVKKTFAKENGIRDISDLASVQGTATAGFTAEFNDRDDGNRGLTSLYGLNLTVKTMDPSLRYSAINDGQVQIVDAYSTDAEIAQYNLVTLTDSKHLFPPYQGAPLMKESLVRKHPELRTILNELAGKISDSEMSRMNYQVKFEGKPASTVAHDYLVKEGLLKKYKAKDNSKGKAKRKRGKEGKVKSKGLEAIEDTKNGAPANRRPIFSLILQASFQTSLQDCLTASRLAFGHPSASSCCRSSCRSYRSCHARRSGPDPNRRSRTWPGGWR